MGFIETRRSPDLDGFAPSRSRRSSSSSRGAVGAKAIVKGLRAISDFEYELEMNQLNRRQDPEIESVYLMASPQYSFLSSSGVKELATFGGRIDDLVPARGGRALAGRAEALTKLGGVEKMSTSPRQSPGPRPHEVIARWMSSY